MNKYKSKKITVQGEVFDSRKEYGRWCELKLLEKAGEIRLLERQKKFKLIPAQRDSVGNLLERSCVYVCDFCYEQKMFDGSWRFTVEDAKGARTKDYIIKRKLMLFIYGIRIKET